MREPSLNPEGMLDMAFVATMQLSPVTMTENLQRVADQAIQFAKNEIAQFGVPDEAHFDFCLEKALWLAHAIGANANLVAIGATMMDIKLGQAFHEKRVQDHVAMSVQAAREFLSPFHLSQTEQESILNAVEAHHGGVPFLSMESEICANADCYKFIHPKGVFMYLTILGRRMTDYRACLDQAEAKMDEKMKMLSLPIAKGELQVFYDVFKQYFALSR